MNVVRAFAHALLAAVMLTSLTPAFAQSALGTTKHALDGNHAALCSGETAFGNVIANAMREASSADVALIDCGAIKSDRVFPASSELTMVEATAALPAGKLAVVEVSGLKLLVALEHAFSGAAGDERFPQLAGLRVDVDMAKPAYQRIVRVTANGAALEFGRNYKLATTDAILAGAHGYELTVGSTTIDAGTKSLADAFANYVRKEGIVDVKAWGRIEFTQ